MFRLPICAIVLSALLSVPATTVAECVPSTDPCAPKKVVGEWEKSGLVGFNLTSGNSDTTLLTTGLKAALDKDGNLWNFGLEYGFGEDNDRNDPETGDTSRNDLRFNGRYDHLLSERLYAGFGTKFLYDEIADVDYRVNLDPNLGYFILRDNSFKFSLEGGPAYIFERVGGIEDDYLAARFGDRFEWAISCTSKLYQAAEVVMDVSDTDNYIVNAELGVEAALNASMALVLTIRESYDNVPAEGREKDDLAVISALKFLL